MKWTKEIERVFNASGFQLPGMESQYLLAPPYREEKVKETELKRMSEASVVLAIYPKAASYHLAFMKRAEHPHDKHSGQISFPGGKSEEHDDNLQDTALREFEEEMGVKRASFQTVFPMTTLRIPVSNFQVNPFVAISEEELSFIPEISEVAGVLEPKMEELFDLDRYGIDSLQLKSGLKIRVPSFLFQEERVWGATAMILSEFLSIVNAEFFQKLKEKLNP